jgi:hypothetical protein
MMHGESNIKFMMIVVDNQKNFQTNLSVLGLNARNRDQLYLSIASLSCFQRGVSYSAMKIFNSYQIY